MNDLKNLTGFAKNLSWIGLYKGRQLWKWVDGSMAHYFNWYKLGDCASIRSDGFWNNRSCGNELPYVCGKFPMWDLDESQLSWSNANNSCDGETLAILHNANENGNVTGVLKGNEAWIGLSKDSQNWLWVDQTLLTYSNWFTNFLCATMDCEGFWHDTSCFEKNPFVCIGQINSNLTYELFSESKTWKEAQSHCEMGNMKLAMLKTEEDITPLLAQICKTDMDSHYFWIGLYNDPWFWSAAWGTDVRNWNRMQPDVRSMILLSEHKSWEEALNHCRHKYVDLASLGSEAEQEVAVRKIEDVQSVYVWTGLRFLAGSWFWVYGDGLQYENWIGGEQPQCPDVTRRCGALAVATGKWEPRSCEEKLEFLCFQK
ncbi:C-type mannose receptor 2-like [Triplophysa rosa]|uniref:C-type mannose receptor 2-like n=1 Tax=Triplophysa rosa TaxID=992332 RepID=UPI002545FF9E|nr:C-type mannose receptor 2-like [Triplophysa rosa]